MLIAVTARSCGHCLDFEPTYRWAAPATEKYGVPLVRVDADREKDFIDQYKYRKDQLKLHLDLREIIRVM